MPELLRSMRPAEASQRSTRRPYVSSWMLIIVTLNDITRHELSTRLHHHWYEVRGTCYRSLQTFIDGEVSMWCIARWRMHYAVQGRRNLWKLACSTPPRSFCTSYSSIYSCT
jgi:hypothetical protein